MLVTKNTKKTVTIEMQPGERVGLDNDGYSIDSITLRWVGNDDLKSKLAKAINDMEKYKIRDDESYMLSIEAEDRKEEILHSMIETLPAYRIKRVWTGFNW